MDVRGEDREGRKDNNHRFLRDIFRMVVTVLLVHAMPRAREHVQATKKKE